MAVKKRFIWMLIAVLALAAVGTAIFALAADAPCTQVMAVKGIVQHRGTEAGHWAVLKAGAGLRAGEWVRTGPRSQADLVILNRYRIRMDESTMIRIPQDTLTGHIHAIYLSTGRVWAQVFGDGQAETRFEVETDAAVAGVRGTVFSVSHDRNTTVSVFEGRVAVSDRKRERTVLLNSGTQTTVKPGRGPSPITPLSPSEKTQWNKVRGWIQKGKGPIPKDKDKEGPNGDEKPGAGHGGSKGETTDKNQYESRGGPPAEG